MFFKFWKGSKPENRKKTPSLDVTFPPKRPPGLPSEMRICQKSGLRGAVSTGDLSPPGPRSWPWAWIMAVAGTSGVPGLLDSFLTSCPAGFIPACEKLTKTRTTRWTSRSCRTSWRSSTSRWMTAMPERSSGWGRMWGLGLPGSVSLTAARDLLWTLPTWCPGSAGMWPLSDKLPGGWGDWDLLQDIDPEEGDQPHL